jgi:hypothetical protein
VQALIDRDDEDAEQQPQPTQARKKKVLRNWTLVRTFDTAAAATEWAKSERIWSLTHSYETKGDNNATYRCNQVPYRHEVQCECAMCLFFCDNSNKVQCHVTVEEHNHTEIMSTVNVRGMTQSTRAYVDGFAEL